MVRFGSHLLASKVPGWEEGYVDYNKLREDAKNPSTDPVEFHKLWSDELERCNRYMSLMARESTHALLALRSENELARKIATQLPGLCKETNRGYRSAYGFVGGIVMDPSEWTDHPNSKADALELQNKVLHLFERQHHFSLVNVEALRKLASKIRKYVDTIKSDELECDLSVSFLASSTSVEFYHKVRSVVNECLGIDSDTDSESSKEEMKMRNRASYRLRKTQAESEFDRLCDMVKSLDKTVIEHIVAHRGFHSRGDVLNRPLENTIPAYEQAWASGLLYCECDITLTLDGKLVLSHDSSLRRLARDPSASNAELPVSQMTYEELFSFPLKNGTHAPLLVEVLKCAVRTGPHAKLVVEIKAGCDGAQVAAALCTLFEEHPTLLKRVAVVMSFDLFIIHNFNNFFRAKFMDGRSSELDYPKVLFLTVNSGWNNDSVILDWDNKDPDSVLNELYGYLIQGESRLDGVYMQMHPAMLTKGDVYHACKALTKEFALGIWGSRAQADKLDIVKLLGTMGASFVNTDLSEGFEVEDD